jgi:hypothetical protein
MPAREKEIVVTLPVWLTRRGFVCDWGVSVAICARGVRSAYR